MSSRNFVQIWHVGMASMISGVLFWRAFYDWLDYEDYRGALPRLPFSASSQYGTGYFGFVNTFLYMHGLYKQSNTRAYPPPANKQTTAYCFSDILYGRGRIAAFAVFRQFLISP